MYIYAGSKAWIRAICEWPPATYPNALVTYIYMYLVKSVFNAPVPVYCLAQVSALSAHTAEVVMLQIVASDCFTRVMSNDPEKVSWTTASQCEDNVRVSALHALNSNNK